MSAAGEDEKDNNDKHFTFPGVKLPDGIADFKLPEGISDLNLATLLPVGTTLGFGTMSGFASGFAVKKGARAATGVLGGLFCLFQGAHHLGYVTVNMDKIENDVMKAMDTNGDGKFDEKDAQEWVSKAVTLLTCDTKISAASFTFGFLAGLRQG